MFRKDEEYALTRGDSWNPFKRTYTLLRDYTFNWMDAEYTIPAGYKWDGPTGVPVFEFFTNGWVEPSLVHDYLYENHFWMTKTHLFTQEDVDDRFIYDLKRGGVGWISTFLIDKFYRRVFSNYWESSESVKLSVPLIKDIIIALIFTAAFLFFYYKFQGVLISAFLGLFAA